MGRELREGIGGGDRVWVGRELREVKGYEVKGKDVVTKERVHNEMTKTRDWGHGRRVTGYGGKGE